MSAKQPWGDLLSGCMRRLTPPYNCAPSFLRSREDLRGVFHGDGYGPSTNWHYFSYTGVLEVNQIIYSSRYLMCIMQRVPGYLLFIR